MKFAVSSDQKDYFRKNGLIPFNNLLNESELVKINQGIDEMLKAQKKKHLTSQEQFSVGRDLWRQNEEIKKIVLGRRLSHLAFELLQKKPLRLAFDQLLPEASSTVLEKERYFKEDVTFQEISSISNLQGIFLLCIKTFGDETANIEAGSGYFFLPGTVFPFASFTPSKNCRFLLVGYGDPYSQYLHVTNDPQVHYLKKLGYVFGDHLNDSLHPLLLR